MGDQAAGLAPPTKNKHGEGVKLRIKNCDGKSVDQDKAKASFVGADKNRRRVQGTSAAVATCETQIPGRQTNNSVAASMPLSAASKNSMMATAVLSEELEEVESDVSGVVSGSAVITAVQ